MTRTSSQEPAETGKAAGGTSLGCSLLAALFFLAMGLGFGALVLAVRHLAITELTRSGAVGVFAPTIDFVSLPFLLFASFVTGAAFLAPGANAPDRDGTGAFGTAARIALLAAPLCIVLTVESIRGTPFRASAIVAWLAIALLVGLALRVALGRRRWVRAAQAIATRWPGRARRPISDEATASSPRRERAWRTDRFLAVAVPLLPYGTVDGLTITSLVALLAARLSGSAGLVGALYIVTCILLIASHLEDLGRRIHDRAMGRPRWLGHTIVTASTLGLAWVVAPILAHPSSQHEPSTAPQAYTAVEALMRLACFWSAMAVTHLGASLLAVRSFSRRPTVANLDMQIAELLTPDACPLLPALVRGSIPALPGYRKRAAELLARGVLAGVGGGLARMPAALEWALAPPERVLRGFCDVDAGVSALGGRSPLDAVAYAARGQRLLRRGDLALAGVDLALAWNALRRTRLVRSAPVFGQIAADLGWTLLRQGRPEAALEVLEWFMLPEAADCPLDPEVSARAALWLAQTQRMLGRSSAWQRAALHLRSCLLPLVPLPIRTILRRREEFDASRERFALKSLTEGERDALTYVALNADEIRWWRGSAMAQFVQYLPTPLVVMIVDHLAEGAKDMMSDAEAFDWVFAFQALARSVREARLAASVAVWRVLLLQDRTAATARQAAADLNLQSSKAKSPALALRAEARFLEAVARSRLSERPVDLLTSALDAARAAHRLDLEIQTLEVRADVFRRMRRGLECAEDLAAAVSAQFELGRRIGAEELKSSGADRREQLARKAVAAALDAGAPELALEMAEATRCRALLDALGGAQASPLARRSEALQRVQDLARRIEGAKIIAATGSDDVRASSVDQLEAEYAEVRRQFRERDSPLSAYLGVSTVRHDEITAALDPREAVVSFSELAKGLVVFVTRASGTSYSWIDDRARLYRLASELVSILDTGGGVPPTRVTARLGATLLADLCVRLFGGVADALVDLSHLVVVPTDHLLAVPFAALVPDPSTPLEYLSDHVTIGMAPSISALLMCRRRLATKPEIRRALLVPVENDGVHEPLVSARTEVASIAEILEEDVEVRLSSVRDDIVRSAPNNELLHFACHANFVPEQPMMAHLCLCDGARLTMMELRELVLKQTRVAVLSACETGRESGGEGSEGYGLVRALLEAGVADVVASAWRVDDEVCDIYMKTFYEQLAFGVPPTLAATAASERVRDEGWTHPKFWAAFRVCGAASNAVLAEDASSTRAEEP